MSENAGKQVTVKPVDKLKNIMAMPSVQEQFRNALSDNAPLFVASLIDLYNGDSYLQRCDPGQVVMEALKAATLKLPLNRNLGFAWIVPFGNKPQFQIGWRGIVQLALRTGQYKSVNSGPVFEGELKRIDKISGTVDLSGEALSEKEIGYFAFFELINGYQKTAYWSREKIEKHAIKYNQECKKAGKLVGNWKEHFSSRAASTVLKHLIKNFGIMSVEMEQALGRDEDVFEAEYREHANSTPLTPMQTGPEDREVVESETIDQDTGEIVQESVETATEECPFPVG